MTTAAGIALGCHMSDMEVNVHGFGVCDTPKYFYEFMDETLYKPMFEGANPDVTMPHARDIVKMHQARAAG